MKNIFDRLLKYLQSKCEHPDKYVSVDILEGCGGDYSIGYCNKCGSVAIKYKAQLGYDWRKPDPLLWSNF